MQSFNRELYTRAIAEMDSFEEKDIDNAISMMSKATTRFEAYRALTSVTSIRFRAIEELMDTFNYLPRASEEKFVTFVKPGKYSGFKGLAMPGHIDTMLEAALTIVGKMFEFKTIAPEYVVTSTLSGVIEAMSDNQELALVSECLTMNKFTESVQLLKRVCSKL
jgi:hypothetical protein